MLRVLIFRLVEPLVVVLADYLHAVSHRMVDESEPSMETERRNCLIADQHRRFLAKGAGSNKLADQGS